MIIFLYGRDTYRSQKKLNEIIEHHRKIHKSGLNLKFFEGDPKGGASQSYGARNLNFSDFKNEIETISMFQEKKLLILKDIFSNENFQKDFLKQGEKIVDSSNIILIYEKKEIERKNPLFKFLKEKAKSQEFKPLENQKLRNWVNKEFEKYGVKIEEKALTKLIEFVGNDLWQMSNEIKKLATFKFKYKSGATILKFCKVEEGDVELLVKPKIESDIFVTIDSIAKKNKKEALSLIHKHLEKGDSPLYLLSMINFQFRNLLMIKSHELGRKFYANDIQIFSKRLKMHPYVIRKTMQQTRRFTLEELKTIYQKIFQADYQIKTGKIEATTALDLLITEI